MECEKFREVRHLRCPNCPKEVCTSYPDLPDRMKSVSRPSQDQGERVERMRICGEWVVDD